MTFAMPMAVFPALAEQLGGTAAVGFLYSAMSVGALLVTFFSGWTRNVDRRGAAVVIAAALWGVAIVGARLRDVAAGRRRRASCSPAPPTW